MLKKIHNLVAAAMKKQWLAACLRASVVAVCLAVPATASAERIRDVCRLKNEVPNELMGMGLVTGLQGTGDSGEFLPAMRPLKELMKRLDDPVLVDKELKTVNNVAIVMLSVAIPPQGAHAGQQLDLKVTAIAAKSLKGGRLGVVPLIAPTTGQKVVLGWASGELMLDDENHKTSATIRGGAKLIQDILPEEIHDNQFTLVLDPKSASAEKASAIADEINEEVSRQTWGKPVAVAVDASSVVVTIPPPERSNPTPFVGSIMALPLQNKLPEPAIVRINTKNNSIIFTEEVELAPTMISFDTLTITVAAPGQAANPPGSKVPFVALDAHGNGNAKLKDLENAFNLLKISAKDRVKIVQDLYDANVLKAKLILD
jgi:flagellar P-ring protein precursor FlgI